MSDTKFGTIRSTAAGCLLLGANIRKNPVHPSDQLLAAVHDGSTLAARRAIDAGADVNYEDEDGTTPLMTACYLGDLTLVKLLIKRGADVNHWSQGDNPLRRAAAGGRRKVYEYLTRLVSKDVRESADEKLLERGERDREREADPNINDFILKAAKGQLAEVDAALAAGADVNAFNSEGLTALHYAALYGHLSLVQRLLEAGAAVDQQSESNGQTALNLVAASIWAQDRAAIIHVLVAAGANIDAQDSRGQTPLMYAVDNGFSGYADSMTALLELGARLDVRDSNDRTAADIALLRKRSEEMIAILQPKDTAG